MEAGGGEGFEVTKYGHGRVALIGFPRSEGLRFLYLGKCVYICFSTLVKLCCSFRIWRLMVLGKLMEVVVLCSVGKSTLLTMLTGTHSEAASYEFTTLTCIPGVIHYNDTKIQLLDLPGIIEGASEGKGRGRQV